MDFDGGAIPWHAAAVHRRPRWPIFALWRQGGAPRARISEPPKERRGLQAARVAGRGPAPTSRAPCLCWLHGSLRRANPAYVSRGIATAEWPFSPRAPAPARRRGESLSSVPSTNAPAATWGRFEERRPFAAAPGRPTAGAPSGARMRGAPHASTVAMSARAPPVGRVRSPGLAGPMPARSTRAPVARWGVEAGSRRSAACEGRRVVEAQGPLVANE